jgi:hypothetical protein
METIDKIVHERIWVTEYEDTCPLREPATINQNDWDPDTDQMLNYGFHIYKQKMTIPLYTHTADSIYIYIYIYVLHNLTLVFCCVS